MNNRRRSVLVLSVSALLFLTTVSAHGFAKQFPVPKWLTTTPIAQQMIINGIPSEVVQFEAYDTSEKLLRFYRKKWKTTTAGKTGYRESNIPPWHIIARLDKQYLYTVQVKDGADFQIVGYLALANLREIKKVKKAGSTAVPQMKGSTVLNDVTSVDPGITGRTLLLANRYSVNSNSTYYRNYYTDHGWNTLMDQNGGDARILAFTKNDREAHLVLSSSGGSTTIVMNVTKKN